jgi:short subunit fatty acids transporter
MQKYDRLRMVKITAIWTKIGTVYKYMVQKRCITRSGFKCKNFTHFFVGISLYNTKHQALNIFMNHI